MPRRRRDCPICSKKNLAKLSNHLADIHQLSGEERQHYLFKARSLSDQRESEEMLNRKRMRSESDLKCQLHQVVTKGIRKER